MRFPGSLIGPGPYGPKIDDLNPIWVRLLGRRHYQIPQICLLIHTSSYNYHQCQQYYAAIFRHHSRLAKRESIVRRSCRACDDVWQNFTTRWTHVNATRLGVTAGLAAIKQLYEWFSPSVCPSVLLSVRLSHILENVPLIVSSWNFDKSDVHEKGQGQRSKVKVTEVKIKFSRFRTLTTVWIHIWQWNDAQSLMWHRRDVL